MNLGQVGKQRESLLVSQWHINDAMMGEGGHGCNGSGLLSATLRSIGDEDSCQLVIVSSFLPLTSSAVPERLPLGRKVAIASGNSNQEAVLLLKDSRIPYQRDSSRLARRVNLI